MPTRRALPMASTAAWAPWTVRVVRCLCHCALAATTCRNQGNRSVEAHVPYRVTFKADYVEKRSRLTTFFRLLLAIPHIIFLYFYGLAAGVLVIVAWFALLFTGRYPQGMYDFVGGSLRYSTRVYGYLWLLTDEYPPFSGSAATPYPVDLNISAPKSEYSRLKVLFRLILAIPVLIIHYAMQIVAQ